MSGIKIVTPHFLDNLSSDCIYRTEEYEVKRWLFGTSMQQVNGWNDCFCIVMVTNGEYSFDISKNKYNTYTGHVILEKPNFEYSLRPTNGKCTIVNFSNSFYEMLCNEPLTTKSSFLSNRNLISQLLLSNSVIDYLHYKIITENHQACRLQMDDVIFELLYEIFDTSTNLCALKSGNREYQNHQLPVVERAKEYIHVNFKEDIGIQEIAQNCFASPFHFSRIFKKFTLQSPYQYLLSIRLKHSEILLKSNMLSIAEVAVSSGFSNPDYFATAFKKKYKLMPTDFRKKANNKE
jgi:AraC family transcriptional regulator